MVMVVQQLFFKVCVIIGFWMEIGFYYDFDNFDFFIEVDLKVIKKGMIKIINKKLFFECVEVSCNEVEEKIKVQNEFYKFEIFEGLQELIIFYIFGEDWWDFCVGFYVDYIG